MMRVEESEERRRAAVLQDTMSIAVADIIIFRQDELDGESGEYFQVAPLGNRFLVGNVSSF
jgi:hypothetical protein